MWLLLLLCGYCYYFCSSFCKMVVDKNEKSIKALTNKRIILFILSVFLSFLSTEMSIY